MTINNAEKFVDSLWDWSIFDGCFGATKIKMQDVDGEVERNFKFLRIETKSPGVSLNEGQSILLKNLVDNPQQTALVVWGEPGKPERVRIITKHFDKTMPCNLEQLRTIVRTWYQMADNPNYWIEEAIKRASRCNGHSIREVGEVLYQSASRI
jgi:hypothetical protein